MGAACPLNVLELEPEPWGMVGRRRVTKNVARGCLCGTATAVGPADLCGQRTARHLAHTVALISYLLDQPLYFRSAVGDMRGSGIGLQGAGRGVRFA